RRSSDPTAGSPIPWAARRPGIEPAGANDVEGAEIFHVLSRQLPVVGGLRQHARPRELRWRRHQRTAQDRTGARGQRRRGRRGLVRRLRQRRRRGAPPRRALRRGWPWGLGCGLLSARVSLLSDGRTLSYPEGQAALDVYRTAVDCFHRFAVLTDVKIEIVEVPFEGKSLPGYFVHAQNATSARAPCVVFFDGLDVTKEIQYLAGVPELIKRGISVLVMDGPGTGEAIRFRGLVLRHDYEKAGSA